MDFQAFVDTCSVPCAVLSVVKTPEGHCGPIHIVCANQTYKDTMGPAYYDGMAYEELVPKDVKFEDFCFRAAHMNQRMHAYVETVALHCWTDQVMIPLQPQSGNVGYCQFLFEFTETAEAERMAGVSADTAAAVVKASITLLGSDDFVTGVRDVLTDILDASGAFMARIMLIDHEKREAINFCEKVRSDEVPSADAGDGVIPYDIVASWEPMIGVSNAVIAKNEREMDALEERNPTWIKSMRQYGVSNIILIPLRHTKTIIGYLYIVNFDSSKAVEAKELIELMSFFLGSEISNYLLMQRLEELSTLDRLTGLLNRNAMLERMKEINEQVARHNSGEDAERTPFGLVTIDLNGLKATNDLEGHEAGDRLLIKTAHVLGSVFRKSDLYRMGGDEFVIIASGMSRDQFEQRVEELSAAAKAQGDMNFAIGSLWSDGTRNAREAFRRADAQMYADKRAYYLEHSR